MIHVTSGRYAIPASALLLLWSGLASAHSMHQSAVLLDFRGNSVQAELQLPLDRLAIGFRKTVDQGNLPALHDELQSYILAHVHPALPDGRPLPVRFISIGIETVENSPYLVVHLAFTPPSAEKIDRFTLNYDVITHEIVTHVVLVSIRSDSNAHIPPNDPLLLGILRGERKSLPVDRMRIL